jgi:hypothetical protein
MRYRFGVISEKGVRDSNDAFAFTSEDSDRRCAKHEKRHEGDLHP